MKRSKGDTPVRRALRDGSDLRKRVSDGLGAVAKPHRDYLDPSIRERFADSLDLDAALREEHEQENRCAPASSGT